jgi:hypothetical protein
MTAIYSHSTVIPPENGNKITDHDASQNSFDVYEAYQSALSDEEVSQFHVSEKRVLIRASRYLLL